jgi:hypothetical protein
LIKRLVRLLKLLVPLVIAVFIARAIHRNWEQVRDAQWTLQPLYLAGSLLLLTPWFVLRPWVWGLIVEHFGHPIPFAASYRVMRLSELSRFVPGAVWKYLSGIYLGKKWGVPAAVVLAATVVETVLICLAGIPFAIWKLPGVLPQLEDYQRYLLYAFPLIAFAVIHPAVLNLWAELLAKKIGQPYEPLRIGWASMLGYWALYLLTWLGQVAGAGLFICGVIEIPLSEAFLIAPGGAGVREGALGLLLRSVIPLGAALTVAVALRLWFTVIELGWAALAQWMPQPPEGESFEAGPERR